MRYRTIDPGLFVANRQKVFDLMEDGSVAVLFGSDPMHRNGDLSFPYRQSSDFFYLTGIEQEGSALIMRKSGKELLALLFIIEPNETMVIWEGRKLSQEQAAEISGIKTVLFSSQFDSQLAALANDCSLIYLNKNENPRAKFDLPTSDERRGRELMDRLYLHRFARLAPLMTNARLIKSDIEIGLIRRACAITEQAFRRILSCVRPGMMEYEVEAEVWHEFIRSGATGHAYEPIIAAGENSCYLHYNANDCPLRGGDLLFMDFGAEYANYAADMSRSIPINGTFSPRQRQVYEAVLRVMSHAKNILRPGITIKDYHKQVCEIMNQELIGLGLYTQDESRQAPADKPLYLRYYMHGTSHFMGLDTHDVGSKDIPLQAGMVLSCEPGIYIREEGIGIRLENDILITESGCEDLMEQLPIHPDEIETLMAEGRNNSSGAPHHMG